MNESKKQTTDNQAAADRRLLVTIGIAVILLGALWIWKSVALSNNRRYLKEQATAQMLESNIRQLKMLAIPYVWAARKEIMQGNINQLNLYAGDIIKQPGLQRVVIADDKGTVISSTNKKDEGQSLSAIYNEDYQESDSTIVTHRGDSILTMTSPLMGFNSKLGTLLIKYKPPVPDLND
ncbi:MAG: hypothetical protein ABI480_02300 [Chitinophagaceae bacterium]